MPDPIQEVVIEVVRQALFLFSGSEDRKVLKEAGKLHFWSDGMLHELKIIRDGRANDDTYAALKKKSGENAPQASAAMKKLRSARDKLGGGSVAKAIDECLSADGYGKGMILMNISELLDYHPDPISTAQFAGRIINNIETLNAALDRLRRLVQD